VDGHHLNRQRNLAGRIKKHDRLPAIDDHLDLVYVAALVGDPPLTSDLPTTFIPGCRLPIRGIDNPGSLGTNDTGLGHGPSGAVASDLQVP
jgi:hypothetical protein